MNILRHLKPYSWLLVTLVALVYLQVMANLALPGLMAKIINQGVVVGDIGAVRHNGLWMIGITFAGGLAAVAAGFLASRTATGFARDLRRLTFAKIENFSSAEFNKFSTASLITRSTNDIQQIQTVMAMVLRMMLMAPFMAIGALQNALVNAPDLSWIITFSVLVLIGVIISLLITGVPRFRRVQQLVDRLNLVLREQLTGLRVVRALNRQGHEEQRFNLVNTDLTKLNLSVNRLMIIMQPFMMLIMNMATIAVVWFGAQLISTNSLEIGNMMAFMQYTIQVIMSFLMLSISFIIIPRGAVSARRVDQVLQTELSIQEPVRSKSVAKNAVGRLEFKAVSFQYPDAESPVLSDISFTAEAGQTTAFIGSTGSGKSTLVNLIPRFYDVSAGQILIDGIDIRDFKLTDLNRQIGLVPQKGLLFSGTIRQNIAYGNPRATKKDIDRAAIVSQSMEFIKRDKKGLDRQISQGGGNVSGGQRQRLSIARALAVKPNVYIFDDSFSALDLKTDLKVRRALAKEIGGKTVVIVGQRISTIVNADKIIVINEGKIVGQGTHHQLLKDNHVYQQIARSQLSDKELVDTLEDDLGGGSDG